LRRLGRKLPEDINQYRRRVSHWFQKAYLQRCQEMIDEHVLWTIVGEGEARIYIDAVEPLESVVNPRYDRRSFDMFKKMYPPVSGPE
jgi:hypothetical protein